MEECVILYLIWRLTVLYCSCIMFKDTMFASEGKSLSGCGKQYLVSSIFAIALPLKQHVFLKAVDMEQKGCFNYEQKKRMAKIQSGLWEFTSYCASDRNEPVIYIICVDMSQNQKGHCHSVRSLHLCNSIHLCPEKLGINWVELN